MLKPLWPIYADNIGQEGLSVEAKRRSLAMQDDLLPSSMYLLQMVKQKICLHAPPALTKQILSTS